MRTEILTGSKSEIAAAVTRIDGEIREVIAIIDESVPSMPLTKSDDIFAEMDPYTVKAGGADYSRQTLYTRMAGE